MALGVSLLFKSAVSFHILRGYAAANALTLLSGAILYFVELSPKIGDSLIFIAIGIVIIAYTVWNILTLRKQQPFMKRVFSY